MAKTSIVPNLVQKTQHSWCNLLRLLKHRRVSSTFDSNNLSTLKVRSHPSGLLNRVSPVRIGISVDCKDRSLNLGEKRGNDIMIGGKRGVEGLPATRSSQKLDGSLGSRVCLVAEAGPELGQAEETGHELSSTGTEKCSDEDETGDFVWLGASCDGINQLEEIVGSSLISVAVKGGRAVAVTSKVNNGDSIAGLSKLASKRVVCISEIAHGWRADDKRALAGNVDGELTTVGFDECDRHC
ncbi:hypothetical protein HG530_010595 [Fusarium avenaceum]|nr:hypothetical protein HG530_010595 [Fusarium avenaceum]